MDTNCKGHGPERKNGKGDMLLENEMVWFHFIDQVSADGPNSFSLLSCRLLNTCDEEVADNDIFVWVAWDTTPMTTWSHILVLIYSVSVMEQGRTTCPIIDEIQTDGRGIDLSCVFIKCHSRGSTFSQLDRASIDLSPAVNRI